MGLHAIRGIRQKMCYMQINGGCCMIGNQLCLEGSIAHFLIWLLEVPNDSRDVSILGGQHCLRIGRLEALAL